MSKIDITYNTLNAVETQKAFEVLMVWFGNDQTAVLAAMNNNPIAVTNKDTWQIDLDKKVIHVQEWALDAEMVRGRQCRDNGIVYNIIQTHTVNNPAFTPDTVPALYRKAAVILPGQTFPEWNSIGLLDSENNWKNKDRVHWNGKDWESKQDANIFEPGVVANTIWAEVGAIAPPASPCEGVAAWSSAQHWSTYTVGNRRTDGGGLYELHTQAWAQSYAPSSGSGNLSWTFIQACS